MKENLINCLKKIKLVDFIIIAGILIAIAVGFVTYTNIRQTADRQIEATSTIRFQVYIRSVTFTGKEIPLNKNDKTFISIRNVPYSDLKITDVRAKRKQIAIPTINSKKLIIVDDVTQNELYDIIVSLEDTAKITKDGPVVGGNKIKIGLPITLEGNNYKFQGIVSDLQVISSIDNHDVIDNQNTTYDVQ